MSAALNMTNVTAQDNALTPVPTLVVGLGQTGLSCARFLAQHGVPFAVTDSREQPPGIDVLRVELSSVETSLGGFDEKLFGWAQRLVVSPGVPLNEPLIAEAQQRGVEIIGDIELFAQSAQAPIVAVTGSNGKSTVTTLLGEMAKVAGRDVRVGGNIGTPALELIKENEPDFYLLELSGFQLDTTHSLHAAAVVVLNISPDHMDRYDGLAHYIASKQRIYSKAGLGAQGVAVFNRDDEKVAAMMTANVQQKKISFGLDAPDENQFGRISQDNELWLARGKQALLPVAQIAMAGKHAQANALAALALGEVMELPMADMLATLKTFSGLPHRTQFVTKMNDVRWINDSKGTNVGATVSAVEGLTGPLILIAGGQGKGANFSPLVDAVKDKVRTVILLGEDAALMEKVLASVASVLIVNSMEDAVSQAQAVAQPGDTVLLSPACASFDMFDGFAARGDAFMRAVRNLPENQGGAS
jgi:UDP-N-acetylmuramoylalanine--D-glutamate ligase